MQDALECEAPRTRKSRYDVESYVAEWVFLTSAGRRSDDIIAVSAPTKVWFRQNILPQVDKSICSTCNNLFNPQRAGSLTRCSATCGLVEV